MSFHKNTIQKFLTILYWILLFVSVSSYFGFDISADIPSYIYVMGFLMFVGYFQFRILKGYVQFLGYMLWVFFILFMLLNISPQFQNIGNIEVFPEKNFTTKQIQIFNKDVFTADFTADFNNLGTISIPFYPAPKSNEESHRKSLINEKLYVQFNLKDISGLVLYSSPYEIYPLDNDIVFPFGFPKIERSKSKDFIVEIEILGEYNSESQDVMVDVSSSGELLIIPRYVFSLKEIGAYDDIAQFFITKLSAFIKNLDALVVILYLLSYGLLAGKYTESRSDRSSLSFLLLLVLIILVFSRFLSIYFDYFRELSFLVLVNRHISYIGLLSTFTICLMIIRTVDRDFSYKYITKHIAPKKYLFVMVFTFLAISLINIGKLGMSTDEGSTALYVKSILNTGMPCDRGVCYIRGIPYLYFTAIFSQLFSVSEFSIRISGIFLAVLSLFMLYKLWAKLKFSPQILFISLLLVVISDWYIALARYARMYPMMLFLISFSVYLYVIYLKSREIKYLFLYSLVVIISVFNHQLSFLVNLLWFFPIFFHRKALSLKFFVLAIITSLLSVFFVIKNPGILYELNFVGYYDIFLDKLIEDRFWYLKSFQLPDLSLVNSMLLYRPEILLTSILGSVLLFCHKGYEKKLLPYFILAIFGFLFIYNISYSVKYLWWILPFMIPLIVTGMSYIFRSLGIQKHLAILILIAFSSVGLAQILFKDYGDVQASDPFTTPTEVEAYYVDDKTIVEYVLSNFKRGDVIITSYWMQDVYLRLSDVVPNYHISHWDINEYFIKFPYYKLLPSEEGYLLYDSGPELLTSVYDMEKVLSNNQRVWLISSADPIDRRHQYIMNNNFFQWFNAYNPKPVYTGLDGNTKVYLFER